MATFTGMVIKGALNMRKTASSSATVLVQIPENTTLTVIEESGKTAWFKTTYGSYTGYVMASYIAITNDGGTCKNSSSGKLNIRKTPSSSASSLYQAAVDETLRLLDCTSDADWYRVSSASGTGWAMSKYLTILTEPGEEEEEETPSASSTTATTRYSSVTCYKSTDLDESNVWGSFAINVSIPVWLVDPKNEYYKTTWTANGVDNVGYVYSEEVTLVEDNSGSLSVNSTGNSVINCKWELYDLGYHPRQFHDTFDSVTEAAVKVFQEKNGLTVNGIINSATRTAMQSSSTLTWSEKVGAWASRTAPHQWFMDDSKWADHAFPATGNTDGTIEMDGNSITAMAMLLTAFSGSAVTPVEMAEFALDNGYRDQTGTSGVRDVFYTEIGDHCSCVEYNGVGSSLDAVDTHLNADGHLAIIKVNNNNETFSGGASQLVCYNIDGYVYVLSPNSGKDPDPFTLAEWAENGWFVTSYLYTICNG